MLKLQPLQLSAYSTELCHCCCKVFNCFHVRQVSPFDHCTLRSDKGGTSNIIHDSDNSSHVSRSQLGTIPSKYWNVHRLCCNLPYFQNFLNPLLLLASLHRVVYAYVRSRSSKCWCVGVGVRDVTRKRTSDPRFQIEEANISSVYKK